MDTTRELETGAGLAPGAGNLYYSDTTAYLRPDMKLEPLVQRWYAWPHLIAPATQAMNVAFRQLELMRSFLMSPAAHIAANTDPSLYGGPFLALAESDGDSLKALMKDTVSVCGERLAFAKALKSLQPVLDARAKGAALTDLYAALPPILSGLVEIAYDLGHRPRFRLLEELIYQQFDSRPLQQIRVLEESETGRPFFMSTPRLQRPDEVTLKLPFADPRIDSLAAMRTFGGDFPSMARSLQLPPADVARLANCFTSAAPVRRTPNFSGTGLRVRYFGHACVLVQTASAAVLFDPMFSVEPGHGDGRFTCDDLPDVIDCVVLSHNHQDHCVPEMLLQLRHRIRKVLVPRNDPGNLADPSMKLILRELGFTNIGVLDPFDVEQIGDFTLTSLPFAGEHADLNICTKQSILLGAQGTRLMFLVDSDGTDRQMYERVARHIGPGLDAVFLGMECQGAPLSWLYGPLLQKPIGRKEDESRRLSGANSERAMGMLKTFRTRRAFVYAMGQEPWLKYQMGLEYSPDSIQLQEVSRFVAACTQIGVHAEKLHISAEMRLP